jgi:hypothetical protein
MPKRAILVSGREQLLLYPELSVNMPEQSLKLKTLSNRNLIPVQAILA